MHVYLVGGPQGGYDRFYSKVVKMDASWFIEFVSFVRENWQWCAAAIVMLLCLHYLMGNSGSEQGDNNESSSQSNSTGNSCVTTVSPVINVPYYSVSDQKLRSELNPSDRLNFDRVVSNSRHFVDYGTHYSYGNERFAKELKTRASALQQSIMVNDPSCLKGKSFEQCLAAYRLSVITGNVLHEARVNLQQTCASVSKDNRSQPSYKALVDLEKDLFKREQAQNHVSGIIRDYTGASFGARGKRWYAENLSVQSTKRLERSRPLRLPSTIARRYWNSLELV